MLYLYNFCNFFFRDKNSGVSSDPHPFAYSKRVPSAALSAVSAVQRFLLFLHFQIFQTLTFQVARLFNEYTDCFKELLIRKY